jgi:lipopolysaccharide export system permease protein
MLNRVQIDLLKKHIGPFLFCFFTVMFILLMQFLILHVDKLVGKGLPFLVVSELILTNLAYMVVLAAPMAVLVATLMAFGRFTEWNELTAVRAAGVNPFQLMMPVLFVAVLMTVFLSYFSNWMLPEANHKARSLFIDIRMSKPGFDLQEGIFYDGIDGYTFLVRHIDSQSDTLRDITLLQEPRNDRYRATIKAEKGFLESPDQHTLTLHLYEGSILRHIPSDVRGQDTLERSLFGQYRISFDLSSMEFSRSNPEQRSRNDRTMTAQAMLAVIDTLSVEINKEIESFEQRTGGDRVRMDESSWRYRTEPIETDSLMQGVRYTSEFEPLNHLVNHNYQVELINHVMTGLDTYTTGLGNLVTNLQWRKGRIAEFEVEVHKKVSIPFACIIFVLIGAPLGMLTKKGNFGMAAIISAVVLTIYFVAVIQGEKLADRLLISPVMGMWGINILYGLIGIYLTLIISTSFRISSLRRRQ